MSSACFTSPSHLLTQSQRQISIQVHLFGGWTPFSISHINKITPGITREQQSALFLSRHLPTVPHLIIPEPSRRSAPLVGGGQTNRNATSSGYPADHLKASHPPQNKSPHSASIYSQEKPLTMRHVHVHVEHQGTKGCMINRR